MPETLVQLVGTNALCNMIFSNRRSMMEIGHEKMINKALTRGGTALGKAPQIELIRSYLSRGLFPPAVWCSMLKQDQDQREETNKRLSIDVNDYNNIICHHLECKLEEQTVDKVEGHRRSKPRSSKPSSSLSSHSIDVVCVKHLCIIIFPPPTLPSQCGDFRLSSLCAS